MTTYTIESGDTMWSIATKNGIELNELLAANPQITNPATIYVGQKINLLGTDKGNYTVMPGDTMWQIAAKHGVSLIDLIKANPQITNQAIIIPGQKINIPSTTKTPSTPDTTNDIRALETEVIRLVNVERQKAGRSPVTENTEVSKVARTKSQDFINKNYFSHISPTYGNPFDMLKSAGVTFTAGAENIASGQRNAAEVMNSWMSSSGHRANILNASYNQIGAGVARDSNGKLFWTLLLIKS